MGVQPAPGIFQAMILSSMETAEYQDAAEQVVWAWSQSGWSLAMLNQT